MPQGIIYCLHLTDAGSLHHSEISLLGHHLLCRALHTEYGVTVLPNDIDRELGRGVHGKPYLIHYPDIEFNISNSGNLVVLILSTVPVGIDIEYCSGRHSQRLAERIFSASEYRDYLRSSDQERFFFEHWVAKESAVKRTGEGITRSLKSLPDGGWTVHPEIAAGYSCAVSADVPLELLIHHIKENDL